MKLNKAGLDLKKQFEGCRLTAYLCPAKVWTIGWGNTFYADGKPVKQGDKITQAQADELLEIVSNQFAEGVRKLIRQPLNDNQFSALVDFAYNAGLGNLAKSTLLRKVNANPNDPTIRDEFMKWNKAGGRVLNGLTRRRKAEADLYYKIG